MYYSRVISILAWESVSNNSDNNKIQKKMQHNRDSGNKSDIFEYIVYDWDNSTQWANDGSFKKWLSTVNIKLYPYFTPDINLNLK